MLVIMDANDDNGDVFLSLVSFNVKTMCFISPFIFRVQQH